VTKLELTLLLDCGFRGLRLGHLDVLVFDGILTPPLLRIFVEFDTPIWSARESIRRRERLLVGCASDVRLGYAISVRVRIVNDDLASLLIRLKVRSVLFVLGSMAIFCTLEEIFVAVSGQWRAKGVAYS